MWRTAVFTDASYANLNDRVSSVGVYVIFLVNSNNNYCLLTWYSNKIKRVVRSNIGAEALSLRDGLEDAIQHRN